MSQKIKGALIFLAGLLVCLVGIVKVAGDRYPARTEGVSFMEIDQFGDFLDELANQPGQELSMEEKLEILEGLGFTFSEEARQRMEEGAESGYADFLALAGMGELNYETGEWKPLSDQVYALDTEVFDVGAMYPLFFQGLLSISGGEVPITDVVQDDSGVNWEEGSGVWKISLHYAGKPYTIEAQAMTDWLDCSVLKKVNAILEKEGAEKRYYAMWSNYQGMTILFLTPEGAKDFEKATGCSLRTEL